MKLFSLLTVVIILILSISGCTQQAQSQSPVATDIIIIKNFAFDPSTVTVKVGTTVTWKNEDSVMHNIASDPHPTHTDLPELDSKELASGESYSFTFNKTGTFGYHCHLHPNMKGKVMVE